MQITIPIEPQHQERPRYSGRGKFVRVYDPKNTKQFKQAVKAYISGYMIEHNISRFETPLVVTFVFYRNVQKSVSKVEKLRRLNGIHPPDVKPDLSNYLKSVEDAFNGVLWKDDSQIIGEHIIKLYSEQPRIEVVIEEWHEEHLKEFKIAEG